MYSHVFVLSLLLIIVSVVSFVPMVVRYKILLRNNCRFTSCSKKAFDFVHSSTIGPTRSLWAVGGRSIANTDDGVDQEGELQSIKEKIKKLNGGREINLNSPQQVSHAIFGSANRQSTSRQNLLDSLSSLDQQKRTIASLVLKYKQIQTTSRSNTQRNQSTLAIQEDEDNQHDLNTNTDYRSQSDSNLGPYGSIANSLFDTKNCKIPSFWKDPLLEITKPSARSMVSQLNSQICPFGYNPVAVPNDALRTSGSGVSTTTTAGKPGSLLAFCREQKELYPECVLLFRVGEFYESFGLDAVLLVEHCGLNAMAGKARAGCPLRNIQATLDDLTAQNFKVAVYEEATDIVPAKNSKTRLKQRMLSQIVSPASPTYLYDLVLQSNSADLLAGTSVSRPFVGILSSANVGYTIVEINLEAQSVEVSERLTPEAVACRLAAYPPAEPLLAAGDVKEISSARAMRTKHLSLDLVEAPIQGVSEMERCKRIIVRALLSMTENTEGMSEADFTLVSSSSEDELLGVPSTRTNPLYLETAMQLGLMTDFDKTIPPLVEYLLPDSAPASSRRFLRRWLLTPPPPFVADSMATLVGYLQEQGPALPPLSVPLVGKVVSLLRARQASAVVHGELLLAMVAAVQLLNSFACIEPLMILLAYESGIAAEPESVLKRCETAIEIIESIISPVHHHHNKIMNPSNNVDTTSDYGDIIPKAFFERNEIMWRGRVRPEAAPSAYEQVEDAARILSEAVAKDFWAQESSSGKTNSLIVQDIFNNIIALKEIPVDANQDNYFHPRDRNGKLLKNRYTTDGVQTALSEYIIACEQASLEVTRVLSELSQRLCEEGHLPAVVQAAHLNLIISTAMNHAAKANSMGWELASTYESSDEKNSHEDRFVGVWPYWMEKSLAVQNSFGLDGVFFLTAPNMSGKSTLMRSTAAAALLSTVGLCAPLSRDSKIRRFDNLFVRGASADVPTENKSAFGAEMQDIAALLRSCGEKSLVFVDELGRGTSPRDGTSIAAAVLERMALSGMRGIFATHLHDILELKLMGRERIRNVRMATDCEDSDGQYTWTYLLEDGVCMDSLALLTAARFGLPQGVLDRASLFAAMLDPQQQQPQLQQQQPVVDSTENKDGLIGENSPRNSEKDSFGDVLDLAVRVAGPETWPYRIPPMWSSPPSLEGSSCVYIMKLSSSNDEEFYVGETESLAKRIRQHRAKKGEWTEAETVAFSVKGGKSEARNIESLLIQQLAQAGYKMKSTADGRHSQTNLKP